MKIIEATVNDVPALICMSEDDTPPKVMPMEEVEKMLYEIMVKMVSSCITISEGGLPEPPAMDIRAIASKYNLNP